ncbi:plastocyanin/azurin family copper-binding protein [Halorussus salilacus]|uniref:plastocyanin/azurin family copper-binding protein n=1 Tax=Halorussus salilacus TaxID=2953750 RepID=UPI0020A16E70|nr:plastocyanin/azurin family copper-binding protein [Halorussus salilacus]USZ68814.1 plastocyanin/azurin family copper-binding protein [Halorussus salilacus]
MDRRTFLAGGAGATLVALAGCLESGSDGDSDGEEGDDEEEDDYDVGMGASFFRPEEVEVAVGETVVWRNTGNRRHTVTAYEGEIPDDADFFASGDFDSEQAARDAWMDDFGGKIESGEEYEHTFEVPGEYDYFCIPHEASAMVGRVVVTE